MIGWGLAVCAGILFLTHYSNKPGKAASAPESWPQEMSLERSLDKPSLLVLLHPQCSCSRATVRELERILSTVGEHVHTRLLFYESSSMDASWVEGDLWNMASSLPDVELIKDRDGHMTQQFGAFTSGQTLLYDTSGILLFKGGITAARGHEGDNAGKKALLATIKKQTTGSEESHVFGCSILGDS